MHRTAQIAGDGWSGVRAAWAFMLLLFTSVAFAHAQVNGGSDQIARPSATLPESNEAYLISGRVADALAGGNVRLALELIRQIAALPDALVAAPGSQTYYPVWRQAFWLGARLPPAARTAYRQLHDGRVSAALESAAETADLPALRALFRSQIASSHWPAVGRVYIRLLLERGRFGEALDALALLGAHGDLNDVDRFRRVIALAGAGAIESARVELDRMRPPADGAEGEVWRAQRSRVQAWLERQAQASGDGDPAGRCDPALRAALHWSAPLPGGELRRGPEAREALFARIDAERRLPLLRPIFVRDRLFVRAGGAITAYDALTLERIWSTHERVRELGDAIDWRGAGRAADEGSGAWREAGLLLRHQLRHAISADAERVYTIEGVALEDDPRGQVRPTFFGDTIASVRRNDLVARRIETGSEVWSSGVNPQGPLYDVQFQHAPLPVGDRLFVLGVRGEELLLFELDPTSGRIVRQVAVLGPPTYFTQRGGRAMLAADANTLYAVTGNGVVAAFDLGDLGWKWATAYESSLASHLGQQWWKPPSEIRDAPVQAPVLGGDLLIAAPIDAAYVLGIDRFAGRQRWRAPRTAIEHVIGVAASGLLVCSDRVSCLSLEQPLGPPRWRSVPLAIVGDPQLFGGLVYVPTREGVVVLDSTNGMVVADQLEVAQTSESTVAPPRRLRPIHAAPQDPGALVAGPDGVYYVSSNDVAKYADPARLRALSAQEEQDDDETNRALMARAWASALETDYRTALAALDAAPNGAADPQIARLRERLLVALAGQSDDAGERIQWLEAALALAHDSGTRGRVTLALGNALSAAGRVEDAIVRFGEVLVGAAPELLAVDGAPGLRRSSAEVARESLDAIARQAPAALEAWVDQKLDAIDAGELRGPAAMRLAQLDLSPAVAERVRRKLMDAGLAPELAVRVLPAGDLSGEPSTEDVRVMLSRWEIAVALDLTAEAPAAKEAFERAASVKPVEDPALRQRIEFIELAERKLAATRSRAFVADLHPTWEIPGAELLIDGRHSSRSVRNWIPVREYSKRELQLHNVVQTAFPQRATPDDADPDSARSHAVDLQHVAAPLARGEFAPWRCGGAGGWPVVIDGQVAVAPTRGGLVAFGLGPERRAGERLWSYPLERMDDLPPKFNELAVATPAGLALASRSDRLELLEWADGSVRWRRDLGDAEARFVAAVADKVVVQLLDGRLLAFDDATGRSRPMPDATARAQILRVVDDLIVTSDGTRVVVLDGADGHERWRADIGRGTRIARVAGRPWILLVDAEDHCRVLSAADGALMIPEQALNGPPTACAADAQRLYLATFAGRDPESGAWTDAEITAVALDTGDRAWRFRTRCPIPVNTSMLMGNPHYVALLSFERNADEPEERFNGRLLTIDKDSGSVAGEVSIDRATDWSSDVCDINALVTPARVIVQIQADLLAYGSAQ